MEKSSSIDGLEYWLRWQVPVCALIFIIPGVAAVVIVSRTQREPIRSVDLWVPCWRNLNPLWLLLYRAFALVSMVFLLYQTVASFGLVVFYFYTQWTFALVAVYFALGTGISAYGCWIYKTKPLAKSEEVDKFLKKNTEECINETSTSYIAKETNISNRAKGNQVKIDHLMCTWGNLMHIVYQTCAGAVMLTDIVFWCILLPTMPSEAFQLTLLIGSMHSVNAIFLLVDSALNNLRFTWYGIVYFALWSCGYIIFQWTIHACGVNWWPYPFLELSTPWAPLWYFGMALVHVPCYGLYALLVKAEGCVFSRLFPQAFVRSISEDKKQA